MEYPHSNCSTVAAVARQLGKDMQFVNLFRNTVDLQGVPTYRHWGGGRRGRAKKKEKEKAAVG